MISIFKRNIKGMHALCFGLIGVSFLIGFHEIFIEFYERWQLGDNSYCFLVLPLFLYFCWEKRVLFNFANYSLHPSAFFIILIAIILLYLGELGSIETFLYLGIWGCITGVMVMLYGKRTLQLSFPLVILLFIMPLPPFINRMLTFQMKLLASKFSVLILQFMGNSVLLQGNVIDLGDVQLQVVDACSGLRFFVPLILMALLIGFFSTGKIWKRMVLVAIVPVLSVVINIVRIISNALLMINGYEKLAKSLFHEFSGWLVFMLGSFFLMAVVRMLNRIQPEADCSRSDTTLKRTVEDRSGFLSTKIAVSVSILLCVLFIGNGWVLSKRVFFQQIPARDDFASFPMQIGDWQGERKYLSQEILDELWADDYVYATFRSNDEHSTLNLLIPFYEYQGNKNSAHAPESCMLGTGWAQAHSEKRSLILDDQQETTIKTDLWEKGDTKICSAYFFIQRGRIISDPWRNKFYLIWDSFMKRRTDGGLVRIEMQMQPGQSYESAIDVLGTFVEQLLPLLRKYIPS